MRSDDYGSWRGRQRHRNPHHGDGLERRYHGRRLQREAVLRPYVELPNIAVAEFCNYGDYYYESLADGYSQQFYELGVHWEFNEDNPWVLGTYISNEDPLLPVTFSGEELTQNWSYAR